MKLVSMLMGSVAALSGGVQGETLSSPDGSVTATVSIGDADGIKDCLP
jgi:hypothetical protein